VVSRSEPLSVAGFVRFPRPPPELKMPERMSENEPKSVAVAPPAAPPPGAPPNGFAPVNRPPRS